MTSSTSGPLGDLPPELFRQVGHELVDWSARYLTETSRYPVLSRATPGEIRAALPAAPPVAAEPLAAIVRDFESVVVPGVTHWNQAGFMAYFGITGSMPGILAEWLIATLNVNGMLWRTSPAATELEQVTLDWLRQMLGLEPGWFGVIFDTASVASLVAIAASREAAGLDIREKGLAGRADLPPLRIYVSDQTHSSVEKAAITLGIGQANVVKIPSDDQFRLRPDKLGEAIEADQRAGCRPLFVCATVGTTSTTSIDPVPAIADIAEQYGLWLHVDGAYGGNFAVVPELQHVLAGVDRADSFVVNPHKHLFTPIDLSAFFTRRPDVVKRAFSLVPEYLRTDVGDADAVVDYMDYGVQLGRRFRSLKLWFVIRAFGVDGIAARLREHHRLARQFAEWVDGDPAFERLAPTPFSTVCFRVNPGDLTEPELDQRNAAILDRVNASGEIYLSHTRLRGRYALRLAIGNLRTDEATVSLAWDLLRAANRELRPVAAATTQSTATRRPG